MKPKANTCPGGSVRFWHAKTYLLWGNLNSGGALTRIAVGSANCTANGLGGKIGNVETMIICNDSKKKRYRKNMDGGNLCFYKHGSARKRSMFYN